MPQIDQETHYNAMIQLANGINTLTEAMRQLENGTDDELERHMATLHKAFSGVWCEYNFRHGIKRHDPVDTARQRPDETAAELQDDPENPTTRKD